MQTTKQAQAVVISLDAYRERRNGSATSANRGEVRRLSVVEGMHGIEVDESRAEDTHRLLTMPTIGRPDERELV